MYHKMSVSETLISRQNISSCIKPLLSRHKTVSKTPSLEIRAVHPYPKKEWVPGFFLCFRSQFNNKQRVTQGRSQWGAGGADCPPDTKNREGEKKIGKGRKRKRKGKRGKEEKKGRKEKEKGKEGRKKGKKREEGREEGKEKKRGKEG